MNLVLRNIPELELHVKLFNWSNRWLRPTPAYYQTVARVIDPSDMVWDALERWESDARS